jgi:GAF domain-containing protein
MTSLSEDELADLARRIAELEEQLRSAAAERDAAVERQMAATLEQFRLETEVHAALDRQKASAEILRSIGATSGDAVYALRQIAETTAHFFNAPSVTIRIAEGDRWVQDIRVGGGSLASGAHPGSPLIARGASLPATVYQENRQIHIPDLDNIDPSMAHWPAVAARAVGIRTVSGTPLRREGNAIGALIIYRDRLAPFTDEELALQQSFADQAVIAIENARLFNETKEALEQQTATADILKVIASSPSDAQPVFDAIAASANRLVGGYSTAVHRLVDDMVELAAFTPTNPEADAALKAAFPMHRSEVPALALVENGETAQINDAEASDALTRQLGRARGWRSVTFTPLMNRGACIGFIACSRCETGVLADHHAQLLRTFADQAVIAIENARLFNETQEALERQTATADILKVIASNPADVKPVFEAIVARALSLCEAAFGFLTTYDGQRFALGAQRGVPEALVDHLRAGMDEPRPGDAHWRLIEGEDLIENLDQMDEDAYRAGNPLRRAVVELGGARSALVVALRQAGSLCGAITIYRKEVRPFSASQVALLRHFADQAVIAIQNTRLFNQTREALERQTATADILKVIASSPSDVQPVFDAIAESANRLVGGYSTAVFRYIDGIQHLAAFTPTNAAADEVLKSTFPTPIANIPLAHRSKILSGETAQIHDTETGEEFQVRLGRARGFRSAMLTPLMHQGLAIGIISVTRRETGGFADHHVQLLRTFADQAVIAIENTRLFNETREALERQTATADVLKVIATSPSDVRPVFEAIAARAKSLVGGFSSTVFRFIDGVAQLEAFTPTTPEADEVLMSTFPRPVEDYAPFRLTQAGEVMQIPDTEALTDEIGDIARARGFRSMVFAPLMNKGASIGFIAVTRVQPGSFSDHHVQVLQTFADQAVIAIENARLFDEVQAKTRDLEESLQQQTATADVLKVISRSAFDLQTVLDTLVSSAARLCEAEMAFIMRRDGDLYRAGAAVGFTDEYIKFLEDHPITPNRGTMTGRAVIERRAVQTPDVAADPEYTMRESTTLAGQRTALGVPLLRENEPIGAIVIARKRVQEFTEKQIELVSTFADQAVIAIENVRLFEEVRAKTRDLEESLQFQTASADVLKVISRSPDKLQPVLDVIVETSRELCGSDASTIFLQGDGGFHVAAVSGSPPAHLQHLRANPQTISQPGSVLSRMAHEKRTLHYANVMDDPEFARGVTGLGGPRALLSVPLLSDGQVIGAITLRQSHLRPFSQRQIRAIETFADQAVIAISNVRLFDEVQARTRDLAKSLDDLRTAQGRLIQTEKLASLGQLTAGIAHEIKNPLNFVNNFSALSVELTDELNDLLKQATLADKLRGEVGELTALLKDNLGKVVQHGKRADSIVKNMLLHSREGSGEHRPADINALVDESLNLAYHGARAEKPQFNVTLQRDFDPDAGMIEVFPQEITRVLLNMITNGFYAVTKRKTDDGGAGFEPLVTASTRGLSDHVEIRIRDNGTGIPTDVKEKMFNPFFTTKPAGEGTGLGLSMSHDIIVKQHGGTIDVDTEPGVFTEFTIVLPRHKK